MPNELKLCPFCGNKPIDICYTSYPPLYGFSCCDIHGGSSREYSEAVNKWNEAVKQRSDNNAE